MVNTFSQKGAVKKYLIVLAVVIAYLALVWTVYSTQHVQGNWDKSDPKSIGVDWRGIYRPAALAMLRGENPYENSSLSNPAWVLILLAPLAILPSGLSIAAMVVTSVFGYTIAAIRMGVKGWMLAVYLFNPLVWAGASNGQIDWIVAIGYTLPPQIGLFLLVLKPQISLPMILVWLVQAWQHGKWKEVARTFTPVCLAILATFVLYGFWPARVFGDRMADPYNTSFWPTGVVIGAVLLVQAIRSHSRRTAIIAGPFLSPYVGGYSWAVPMLALTGPELIAAVLVIWLISLGILPW